jgi:hypothetical protein
VDPLLTQTIVCDEHLCPSSASFRLVKSNGKDQKANRRYCAGRLNAGDVIRV